MKNIILLTFLVLTSCSSTQEQIDATLNSAPPVSAGCVEVEITSGAPLIGGSARVKYVVLPDNTPIESLTPEIIQTLESVICP